MTTYTQVSQQAQQENTVFDQELQVKVKTLDTSDGPESFKNKMKELFWTQESQTWSADRSLFYEMMNEIQRYFEIVMVRQMVEEAIIETTSYNLKIVNEKFTDYKTARLLFEKYIDDVFEWVFIQEIKQRWTLLHQDQYLYQNKLIIPEGIDEKLLWYFKYIFVGDEANIEWLFWDTMKLIENCVNLNKTSAEMDEIYRAFGFYV